MWTQRKNIKLILKLITFAFATAIWTERNRVNSLCCDNETKVAVRLGASARHTHTEVLLPRVILMKIPCFLVGVPVRSRETHWKCVEWNKIEVGVRDFSSIFSFFWLSSFAAFEQLALHAKEFNCKRICVLLSLSPLSSLVCRKCANSLWCNECGSGNSCETSSRPNDRTLNERLSFVNNLN